MLQAPILIIEDDDDIRLVYRELLESEGYEVDSCANGEEGLEFLRNHPEPCLILLDMLMPVLNGRDFMLGFEKWAESIVPIPVYLVSASANLAEAQQMGCHGFLKKPFDFQKLLEIVQVHCETRIRKQPTLRLPRSTRVNRAYVAPRAHEHTHT